MERERADDRTDLQGLALSKTSADAPNAETVVTTTLVGRDQRR
jgi:hypothetical protein